MNVAAKSTTQAGLYLLEAFKKSYSDNTYQQFAPPFLFSVSEELCNSIKFAAAGQITQNKLTLFASGRGTPLYLDFS